MDDEISLGESPQPDFAGLNETMRFERNEQISNLFIQLLRTIPQEQAESVIFATNSISTILKSDRETNKGIFDRLKERDEQLSESEWETAIEIAKTYYDNLTLRIPDRVIHRGYDSATESDIKAGEKVLIILDSLKRHPIIDEMRFTGRRGTKRHQEEIERPDVYLGTIENEDYDGFSPKDFKIDGCDNIIIGSGAHIEGAYGKVALSGKGDCFILPTTNIAEGRQLSLTVEGNVVQYPGSNISLAEVKCEEYDYIGGDLRPCYLQRPIIITCNKFVYGKNALELDSRLVEINGDIDYVERSENKNAIIIENKIGDVETTTEDTFNKNYIPKDEKSENGVIVREYDIDLGSFADFFTTAITLGWTMSSASQNKTQIAVRLEKDAT